jgi:hypothetical protein
MSALLIISRSCGVLSKAMIDFVQKTVSMKSLLMLENRTFSSCYLSIRSGLNKPSFHDSHVESEPVAPFFDSCRVGQLIILLKPEIVNR